MPPETPEPPEPGAVLLPYLAAGRTDPAIQLTGALVIVGMFAGMIAFGGPTHPAYAGVIAAPFLGYGFDAAVRLKRLHSEHVWVTDRGLYVESPPWPPRDIPWASLLLVELRPDGVFFRDERGRTFILLMPFEAAEHLRRRLMARAPHAATAGLWAALPKADPADPDLPPGVRYDAAGRPAAPAARPGPHRSWVLRQPIANDHPAIAWAAYAVVGAVVALTYGAGLGWAAAPLFAASLAAGAASAASLIDTHLTRLVLDDRGVTLWRPLAGAARVGWNELDTVTYAPGVRRLRLAYRGGVVWVPTGFVGSNRLAEMLRRHAAAAVEPAVWDLLALKEQDAPPPPA